MGAIKPLYSSGYGHIPRTSVRFWSDLSQQISIPSRSVPSFTNRREEFLLRRAKLSRVGFSLPTRAGRTPATPGRWLRCSLRSYRDVSERRLQACGRLVLRFHEQSSKAAPQSQYLAQFSASAQPPDQRPSYCLPASTGIAVGTAGVGGSACGCTFCCAGWTACCITNPATK